MIRPIRGIFLRRITLDTGLLICSSELRLARSRDHDSSQSRTPQVSPAAFVTQGKFRVRRRGLDLEPTVRVIRAEASTPEGLITPTAGVAAADLLACWLTQSVRLTSD